MGTAAGLSGPGMVSHGRVAGRGRPARWAVVVLAGVGCYFAWGHFQIERERIAARRALRVALPDNALQRLQASAERLPDDAEIQYLFSVACRRAGDFDRALEVLGVAAELGWNPKDIQRQRGLMHFQAGDLRSGGPYLKELLLEDATDDEAQEIYEVMARGYMAALLFTEARFALDGWIAWRPRQVEPRLLRAQLAELADDQAAEAEAYRRILEFAPRHYEARRGLARSLMLSHEFNASHKLLADCLGEQPHDPQVLLLLAEWHQRQGQMRDARARVDEALALELERPRRAHALGLAGQLAVSAGDHEAAVRAFGEAAELNPGNISTAYGLSQALMRVGREEESRAAADRWRRLQALEDRLGELRDDLLAHPDDPDLRCDVGSALLEKGDVRAGENWLLSALFHEPGHARTHRRLADYYRQIGQSEAADRHHALAQRAEAGPPSAPLVVAPTGAP